MKNKAKFLITGVLALLWAQSPTQADGQAVPVDEQPAQPGFELPDAPASEKNRGIQYQEQRIGGRLERVTVTRKNGFTEIYRNNRADTLWSAQENEIGEVPNVRRWVIGTW